MADELKKVWAKDRMSFTVKLKPEDDKSYDLSYTEAVEGLKNLSFDALGEETARYLANKQKKESGVPKPKS